MSGHTHKYTNMPAADLMSAMDRYFNTDVVMNGGFIEARSVTVAVSKRDRRQVVPTVRVMAPAPRAASRPARVLLWEQQVAADHARVMSTLSGRLMYRVRRIVDTIKL